MSGYTLTINGREVSTERSFNVLNPADGSIVATCPEATPEDVDAAVKAARNAFPGWSSLNDEDRAVKLKAVADLIEQHHRELSDLITREQGKTQSGPGANLEVGGAVIWTRVTAELVLPAETIQDDASGRITTHRKPLGVVASITPWNWPLMIAVWHIMPAIRVGCTVVLKPSQFTPLSTLRLVSLMNQVLPPGVINVITGGADIGNYMSRHSGIDKIVFTGSIDTGKRVMAAASGTLKRVTLELGGNDAGIVLPGTTLDPLIEKLFWGCFINAGQTCAALKRLYVHEQQYEEVVRKFAAFISGVPVGNGIDPANLIGPLTTDEQRSKIAAMVEEARLLGARIVTGGVLPVTPGFFYPLTLIADATDDMRVVHDEQFGPILPILKYKTVEEAIRRANSLPVGLGGSIWGNDVELAAGYAARLECGTAWVNQHGTLHPLAPFGGVKNSGIGVEFNVDGLKEFTTIQVINVSHECES